MKNFLNNVVQPMIHRIGSIVGVFLASQGIAHDDITIISAGVVALCGVAVDLIIRKVF